MLRDQCVRFFVKDTWWMRKIGTWKRVGRVAEWPAGGFLAPLVKTHMENTKGAILSFSAPLVFKN